MNRTGKRQPLTTYAEPGCGDPDIRIPEKVFSQAQLLEMLPECDHVVVLVPMTDATYHLFDATAFRHMKNSAYFYNYGRGSVVDEPAMIVALQNGQIAGAGLDVFETEPLPDNSPLWDMPNVIITPHVGGLSNDYNDRVIDLFVVNLKKYLAGQPLLNVVDRQLGY
jgi:phosphoglycerate dehydrogenase-like enzyme